MIVLVFTILSSVVSSISTSLDGVIAEPAGESQVIDGTENPAALQDITTSTPGAVIISAGGGWVICGGASRQTKILTEFLK